MDYDNWLVDPWERLEAEARREEDLEERVDALLASVDGIEAALAGTDPTALAEAILEALRARDPAHILKTLRVATRPLEQQRGER